MEDEVGETHLHVGGDPLDGLVRVIRADEAARRIDRRVLRQSLEFDRVLDAVLHLGRKGERRPEVAVAFGLLEVGVVRELDLHQQVEVGERAACLLGTLGERRQELLGVELLRLARRGDEAVGGGAGIARGQRGSRGDVDRWRCVRQVVDRRAACRVVVALERHTLLAPELADQRERFLQALQALRPFGPLDAGRRHLVERLARADAKEDAARRQARQRGKALGDRGRVMAEGRGDDTGADVRVAGTLDERAHPGERERRVAARMTEGLEVV